MRANGFGSRLTLDNLGSRLTAVGTG